MFGRQTGTMLLAALVLAAPACTRDEPRETAREQQAAPNDSLITMNIQSRYFSDDGIKAREIDVDTDKGVVTLTGTVPSETARRQAETIAQGVDGVSRVQNNLRVEADSTTARADDARPDADRNAPAGTQVNAGWITTKIQAQYFGDADVRGRNIDVTTSPDGRVTLTGTVESAAERAEAVRIARATEGVKDVNDSLRIVAPDAADRPAAADKDAKDDKNDDNALTDPWITTKIESKYFLDGDVKGRNIDVTTENGVVTLTGQVTSAAERRQAIVLAQSTDGVKDVRDQLKIVADARDADVDKADMRDTKDTANRTASNVNDEWIEAKIQSKYFLEGDLKNDEISVDVAKGVVTLQGRVESADDKRVAEEIAKETDGVRNVVNRLQVTATPRAPR
jgi:hyperosmotically inducible protein